MTPSRRLLILALLATLVLLPISEAGLRWAPTRLPSDPIGAPAILSQNTLALTQSGRVLAYSNSLGGAQASYNLSTTAHIPPLSEGRLLIVADDGGHIEALDGETMRRRWIYPAVLPSQTNKTGGASTTGALMGGNTGAAANTTNTTGNATLTLEIRSLCSSGAGLIYAIDRTRVLALDSQTGRVRFIKPLLNDGGACGADGEHLFVMDADTLRAYTPNGELSWSLQTGALFKTRPVADPTQGKVYVASTKGQILAIDMQTGRVNWTYSVNGWPASTPQVVDGRVLVASEDGRLRALDAKNGEVVWTTQLMGAVWGEMARVDRGLEHIVLAPTQAPSLAAVDADSGALRWEYALADWPTGGVGVSDGGEWVAVSLRNRQLLQLALSPMCTIDSPRSGQRVGPYLEVRGRAWAWNGARRVSLNVAGEKVDLALGSDGRFVYSADLSDLKDGEISIQCLAESQDNRLESDAGNTKATPILSLELERENLTITTISSTEPGTSLRVFVRNAQGYDLDHLQVNLGETALGDASSPFEIKAPTGSGTYPMTVGRRGFNTQSVNIAVQSDDRPIWFMAGVLVLVLGGVGYMLWSRRPKAREPSIPASGPIGKKTA